MNDYNMMAEYSALVIIVVIIVSFFRDYEVKTLQYRLLRYMYYATFCSVLITIISTLFIEQFFQYIPLWLTELSNVIYFIVVPSAPFTCFIYSVSLIASYNDDVSIIKKLRVASIPYIVYIVFVLANYIHHLCFTIDSEMGYIRGPLFQAVFYLALLYVFLTVILSIKNVNNANRGTLFVLCVNLFLALCISAVQYLFPNITTSGIAAVTGVLVVQLYIQNVKKATDHLTGLSNRMALMHILTGLADKDERFSLYVFSVRNFKSINERQGLEYGDMVLRYISSRITHYFKLHHAFRYNGDEFAILIKSQDQSDRKKIELLIEEFDQPFIVNGFELSIDILYCRVDYPEFGSNVRDLISATDYSIRTLKENSGESNFLYDTTIGKKMGDRNTMVQSLKKAIETSSFEVHYQAIYSTGSKTFSQAEALVRMRDENGILVYPGEFIDIAENTRLIVKITYIVLEKVCADLRRLMDEQGDDFCLSAVSVNFSYLQFFQEDLLEVVTEILEKYDIPPRMINIEITERTLISDAKAVKAIMEAMQAKGFVFELDDFGVDYSNMSMLLNLPVNVIKIDRSLLLAATATPQNESFFEYLINGIKATDRISVIEGVESLEQLDFLLACGCEHIQGFVFSKPLPFQEFREFLIESKSKIHEHS